MNWNIVAEYIKEDGIFSPDVTIRNCDSSIFVEEDSFYLSIFAPTGGYIVVYAGYKKDGKRTSVCNTYPMTEDPYLVVSYLRDDLDDMIQRLDKRLEKVWGFPNFTNSN